MRIGMQHISQLTLDAITAEALNAQMKHTWEHTTFNSDLSSYSKLAVLVEEVGELAQLLTYDHVLDSNVKEKMERELIQIAAVAAMWIDSLNPNQSRNNASQK